MKLKSGRFAMGWKCIYCEHLSMASGDTFTCPKCGKTMQLGHVAVSPEIKQKLIREHGLTEADFISEEESED